MDNSKNLPKFSLQRRIIGWSVHAFTASGACVGLLSLLAIYHHQWISSFWLMYLAIFIDAVDGMFARGVKIKEVVPQIDGALLDNIVDFMNYTIVPCFFLLVTNLLPSNWGMVCVMLIVFCSAYQFTQIDAKTPDNFFKGFPSYWNIVVFYLFFLETNPATNLIILLALAILSFVPIKYVYPSRMEYLTENNSLRMAMTAATILWGLATAGLLWSYPQSNHLFLFLSFSYMVIYLAISLYRTWVPLQLVAE